MAISDKDSEQDLLKEILPDITDSEHEQIGEILGPNFKSWSSIKASFIDGWKSGNDKLVKVVASEEGVQEKVGGYFTEERWIKGCTPEEMEARLGFSKGKLKNGATIYELNEIPDKSQFEVKGYTHMLPQDGTGNRADYVPGSGINQFKLTEPVPATVIGNVGYEEPWKMPATEENVVSSSLSSDSENAPSSEEISKSVGEISGNAAAGPAGGIVGIAAGETTGKAQQDVVESTGQSTEDPVKTNENAARESSSDEEQNYGYGYSY